MALQILFPGHLRRGSHITMRVTLSFQYSGLVLECQTLRHYRGRFRLELGSPWTWSGSVPPSLVCIIMNIAGTVRDQSLKLPFLRGSGHETQW